MKGRMKGRMRTSIMKTTNQKILEKTRSNQSKHPTIKAKRKQCRNARNHKTKLDKTKKTKLRTPGIASKMPTKRRKRKTTRPTHKGKKKTRIKRQNRY